LAGFNIFSLFFLNFGDVVWYLGILPGPLPLRVPGVRGAVYTFLLFFDGGPTGRSPFSVFPLAEGASFFVCPLLGGLGEPGIIFFFPFWVAGTF